MADTDDRADKQYIVRAEPMEAEEFEWRLRPELDPIMRRKLRNHLVQAESPAEARKKALETEERIAEQTGEDQWKIVGTPREA